ncbi:hypothetical protein [Methylobacter sp.]|uniref:hypothetical protein n=1 Tax=Methylobacter sp. TaxID=2051955 RepID=UPI001214FD27|nr:hypothetical protein [Methylobacter sp.]TAK60112.1 MAG: hypothetical protein EPO18_18400 [Methylobacter sp.]
MTKKVDAFFAWKHLLAITNRKIYTEIFNTALRLDFVQKNPEAAKHFLRVLIKMEDFISKNPDDAPGILPTALKIYRRLIRDVWDAFNYQIVLDQTLLIKLMDKIENNLIDGVMSDYLSLIHLNSLKVVKSEVIRVSR